MTILSAIYIRFGKTVLSSKKMYIAIRTNFEEKTGYLSRHYGKL